MQKLFNCTEKCRKLISLENSLLLPQQVTNVNYNKTIINTNLHLLYVNISKINACEMWIWRKMQRISWTEKKTN